MLTPLMTVLDPPPVPLFPPTRPQFLTLCKQRHPLETKCSNAQDYGTIPFRAYLALGARGLSFTLMFSRLTCAEAHNSTLHFHNGIILSYTYIPHF